MAQRCAFQATNPSVEIALSYDALDRLASAGSATKFAYDGLMPVAEHDKVRTSSSGALLAIDRAPRWLRIELAAACITE